MAFNYKDASSFDAKKEAYSKVAKEKIMYKIQKTLSYSSAVTPEFADKAYRLLTVEKLNEISEEKNANRVCGLISCSNSLAKNNYSNKICTISSSSTEEAEKDDDEEEEEILFCSGKCRDNYISLKHSVANNEHYHILPLKYYEFIANEDDKEYVKLWNDLRGLIGENKTESITVEIKERDNTKETSNKVHFEEAEHNFTSEIIVPDEIIAEPKMPPSQQEITKKNIKKLKTELSASNFAKIYMWIMSAIATSDRVHMLFTEDPQIFKKRTVHVRTPSENNIYIDLYNKLEPYIYETISDDKWLEERSKDIRIGVKKILSEFELDNSGNSFRDEELRLLARVLVRGVTEILKKDSKDTESLVINEQEKVVLDLLKGD